MNESAADFERREQWMRDWSGGRADAADRGPMDVAFTLEALGCTPDGFARVLDLIGEIRPGHVPAGLSDVALGYRIGVTAGGSSSGEPLGMYRGAMIVAWTTDLRTSRQG